MKHMIPKRFAAVRDYRVAPPVHVETKLPAELTGLCRGILADGVVHPSEAAFLKGWMQSRASDLIKYPFPQIMARIEAIYADGIATEEECSDLAAMLGAIIGEGETPEIAPDSDLKSSDPRATRFFFDDPAPHVEFAGKLFCPTGTFCTGPRAKIEQRIKELGARLVPAPTLATDFVLVGTFAPEAWKHGNYGTKIETAIKYRENGHPVRLISEQHWLTFVQ